MKTLQELFGVNAPGGGFLGDANTPGTNDFSTLFRPGVIPAGLPAVPEPSSLALLLPGALGLLAVARRRRA